MIDGMRAVRDGNGELIGYISGDEHECYAYEPTQVSETGAQVSGRRFTSLEEAEAYLLTVRE